MCLLKYIVYLILVVNLTIAQHVSFYINVQYNCALIVSEKRRQHSPCYCWKKDCYFYHWDTVILFSSEFAPYISIHFCTSIIYIYFCTMSCTTHTHAHNVIIVLSDCVLAAWCVSGRPGVRCECPSLPGPPLRRPSTSFCLLLLYR